MVKRQTLTPLGRFKAVTLARLIKVRATLLEKYPERREEIEDVVNYITHRLTTLRTKYIPNFVEAVVAASRVYDMPELLEVVPSGEELQKLLNHLQ